jgi:hypothetical protein
VPVSCHDNLIFMLNCAAFALKLAIAVLPSAKNTTMITAAVARSPVAAVLNPAAKWRWQWRRKGSGDRSLKTKLGRERTKLLSLPSATIH